MKYFNLIIIMLLFVTVAACGESKSERANRIEKERQDSIARVEADSIRLASEKAEYARLMEMARRQGVHDGYYGYFPDDENGGFGSWFHEKVFMNKNIRIPSNKEAEEEFKKPLRDSYLEGRKEGDRRQETDRKEREKDEARNKGYEDGYNGYQGWDAVESFDRWFDKKYGIPRNPEVAKKFKDMKKSLRESYTDGLKEGHQAAINAGHF